MFYRFSRIIGYRATTQPWSPKDSRCQEERQAATTRAATLNELRQEGN